MKSNRKKITILDNEYVSMWYYPDTKILHHQVHKFLHGEHLRKTFLEGTKAIQKYGAQKWLSDDRLNSAISKTDQEWNDSAWSPQALRAGWKYWAIVQPENAIGQLNIKRISEKHRKQGIIVQVFSDPDEAMTWLENQGA